MFVRVIYKQSVPTRLYMDIERELKNEGKTWNDRLIRKFLLTVTIADLK